MTNCCSLRCGALTSGFLHAISSAISLILIISDQFFPSNSEMAPKFVPLFRTAKTTIIIILTIIAAMAVMIIIGVTKKKKMFLIPFMSLQFTALIFLIPAFVGSVMFFVATELPSQWFCLHVLMYFTAAIIESVLLTVTYHYFRQPGPYDTFYLINDSTGRI